MNETEACLVKLKVKIGVVITAIAVEDFLAMVSTIEAINEFHNIMNTRYKIKILGQPKRYLCWPFHYTDYGSIALSQPIHFDKILNDAGMLQANGNHTPYPTNT